jgi:hypothetical protein
VFFEYNVTYPPLIFPEEEQIDVLRLTRGIVKRVEVVFPRGCAGLVGVRIFRGPVQVIPLNAPAWLDTDGETISINTEIDLSVNPYELEVRGYNLDDTYSHTIRFRFELELMGKALSIENVQAESASLIERLGL